MKIINKQLIVYVELIWSLNFRTCIKSKKGTCDFYETIGNLNLDPVFDDIKEFLKLLF